MSYSFRFSLVAYTQIITPYLAEWINYHSSIGFDHVYIFSATNTERELMDYFNMSMGPSNRPSILSHPEGLNPEYVIKTAIEDGYLDTEWICFISINEFIRIPAEIKLEDFLGGYSSDFDGIILNRVFFDIATAARVDSVIGAFRRTVEIDTTTRGIFKTSCFLRSSDTALPPEAIFPDEFLDLSVCPAFPINVLGQNISEYFSDFPVDAKNFLDVESYQEWLLQTAVIHVYLNFSGRIDISTATVHDDSLGRHWMSGVNEKLYRPDGLSPEDKFLTPHFNAENSFSIWTFYNNSIEISKIPKHDHGSKTKLEHRAWIHTLSIKAKIRGIYIYPLDEDRPYDLRHFSLSISMDGREWIEVFSERNGEPALRGPLAFYDQEGVKGKIVCLTAFGFWDFFPKEFKIYGEPLRTNDSIVGYRISSQNKKSFLRNGFYVPELVTRDTHLLKQDFNVEKSVAIWVSYNRSMENARHCEAASSGEVVTKYHAWIYLLEEKAQIQAIYIYPIGALETYDLQHYSLSISMDGHEWVDVFVEKNGSRATNGPIKFYDPEGTEGKFICFTAFGSWSFTPLRIDVYGKPLNE